MVYKLIDSSLYLLPTGKSVGWIARAPTGKSVGSFFILLKRHKDKFISKILIPINS